MPDEALNLLKKDVIVEHFNPCNDCNDDDTDFDDSTENDDNSREKIT